MIPGRRWEGRRGSRPDTYRAFFFFFALGAGFPDFLAGSFFVTFFAAFLVAPFVGFTVFLSLPAPFALPTFLALPAFPVLSAFLAVPVVFVLSASLALPAVLGLPASLAFPAVLRLLESL